MAPGNGYDRLWNELKDCTACRNVRGLETIALGPAYVPLPPLPPQPSARLPISYLIVGAEPSDHWRGDAPTSRDEAIRRIENGYRNYTGNVQVIALTFAAREWLLKRGEAYAITDLAKCAMAVADVNSRNRRLRYDACEPQWLKRELLVYRPRAVIAIGDKTKKRLQAFLAAGHHPGVRCYDVPHFSGSNGDKQRVDPSDLIEWPLPGFESYAREILARYHGVTRTNFDAVEKRRFMSPGARKLISLYRREFLNIARSEERKESL